MDSFRENIQRAGGQITTSTLPRHARPMHVVNKSSMQNPVWPRGSCPHLAVPLMRQAAIKFKPTGHAAFSEYSGRVAHVISAKHLLPIFEECVGLAQRRRIALPVAAHDEFALACRSFAGDPTQTTPPWCRSWVLHLEQYPPS